MSQARREGREWFGQPRGLTVLFLTETWEKFSFFGMRAILVYYMTKGLHFPVAKASLVYGGYTACVYLTPIFGGMISDRWLGRRRAVILGGVTMAAGHFMLAFPALFYPALAAIAFGNGFYLPNLPSQIDTLYARDDPRRGSAYNVYYVGINLGAFVAPLLCGALGEWLGWHWGFSAAGFGMCLGLGIYLAGSRWLPAEPSARDRAAPAPVNATPVKGRVLLIIALVAAIVVFRGGYEQMGNSIALWADGSVDRRLGDFVVPGSWFQSLNALIVFAATPVLVAAWTRAAGRGREPSSLRKMSFGALGQAGAFLLLAAVCQLTSAAGVQPPIYVLVSFILLYSVAELFILPVALGLFGRLAGERHRATVIAAFFLTAFFGNLLAGSIGALWGRLPPPTFFALVAVAPLTAALACFVLDRPARRVEAAARERDLATLGPAAVPET